MKSSLLSSKASRTLSRRFSIRDFAIQHKWWERDNEIIEPSNQKNVLVNNQNDGHDGHEDHDDQEVAIELQSKNKYEPSSSQLNEITGLSNIMNRSLNDGSNGHDHHNHEGGENVHLGVSFPLNEFVEDDYDETTNQNRSNHDEETRTTLLFHEQPLIHHNDTSNHDLGQQFMSRDEMNDERSKEEKESSFSFHGCDSNSNNGILYDTSSLAI